MQKETIKRSKLVEFWGDLNLNHITLFNFS
jgi:hypothetical protein